ncbi:MAG: ADP-ribosylglycohydrolase family protein [Geobacter sp.]|nr:ADP-ribosylglycohydrolase family protein [Geobacter sp.]
MIGAIAGDIIGSPYEFRPHKSVDFPLFSAGCRFTDDTVLTIALAEAILTDADYAAVMKQYYLRYPDAGYGGRFRKWAVTTNSNPYRSFGNGAAMRISPVAFYYTTLEEVLVQAEAYTAVTHNHPEGIKGAQATAAAIFLARNGSSKEEIKKYVTATFDYNLSRSCTHMRPDYKFDVTCQGSVPESITCFLESSDYESTVRLAVSLGGDSDTQACIAGGIAEAFYGVPKWIEEKAQDYLDVDLLSVLLHFKSKVSSLSGKDRTTI